MQDCPGCQKFYFPKKIWCEVCLENLQTLGDMSDRIRTLYNYHDPVKSCLVLYKAFGNSYHRQAIIEILQIKKNCWQDLTEWCDYIAPAPQSLRSWLLGKFSVAELMMECLLDGQSKKKLHLPVRISLGKQSNKIRSNVHGQLIAEINNTVSHEPKNSPAFNHSPEKPEDRHGFSNLTSILNRNLTGKSNTNLNSKLNIRAITKIWQSKLTQPMQKGRHELQAASMLEMGRKILIVDDVLTSGSTLLSIMRANAGNDFRILTLCRSRAIDFKATLEKF